MCSQVIEMGHQPGAPCVPWPSGVRIPKGLLLKSSGHVSYLKICLHNCDLV